MRLLFGKTEAAHEFSNWAKLSKNQQRFITRKISYVIIDPTRMKVLSFTNQLISEQLIKCCRLWTQFIPYAVQNVVRH